MYTLKIDNGDVVVEANRFKLVSGREKLGQLLGELLLIDKLENGFGADLVNLRNLDRNMIAVMINDAVNEFRRLQYNSENFGKMDAGEKISDIRNLEVFAEKGLVVFNLEVENMERRVLEIESGFALS